MKERRCKEKLDETLESYSRFAALAVPMLHGGAGGYGLLGLMRPSASSRQPSHASSVTLNLVLCSGDLGHCLYPGLGCREILHSSIRHSMISQNQHGKKKQQDAQVVVTPVGCSRHRLHVVDMTASAGHVDRWSSWHGKSK